MRIACFGYRVWALDIYHELERLTDHSISIFEGTEDINIDALKVLKPDFVLFYGWSWIIPDNIINEFRCIMLHPSPLPKYRGGSPIQNQILDGVTASTVTLFRLTSEMDAGPVVATKGFTLNGHIEEIFERLAEIGTSCTLEMLENYKEIEQDHAEATYYKRRSPPMSEITIDDLQTLSGLQIYNKIRSLEDPYPNAYIQMSDGTKLLLKKTILVEDEVGK